MTINEYQEKSLTTFSKSKSSLLWEGATGINTEAGETLDVLCKYMFQGHPFDKNHMALELGDVLCYVAVTAHALGYTLEEIMEMNLEKREKRYRGSFSIEKSLHRQEGDI